MTLQNYTGLVSAVQEAMEDDSAEFLSYIPTAIELAEFRLTRESDAEFLVSVATVSGTSGNRLLTKPSGYLIGQTLSFTTSSGSIRILKKQTRSWCERYWIYGATSVGEPKYYADYSNSSFLIAPTPDSNFGYSLAYITRPAGISAAVSTNVFTTWMPDALFYATMVEMSKFSRNDFLVVQYEQGYLNAMLGANNSDRRARRDEGAAPMNSNSQMNTLKGDN